MSRAEAWERTQGALDRVGLAGLADRKGAHLSGGQLRRVGIAQCLVHDAEVLLMDEPTAGLDPVQRRVFRDLLGEIGPDVDIVVSTHQTEDIDTSYEHVVVLDEGRPRFRGTVDEFLGPATDSVSRERRAVSAYAAVVTREV